MNKLLILAILVGVAYYLNMDKGMSLAGEWHADSAKTVSSMKEAGRLKGASEAAVAKVMAGIGDLSIIFTDTTMKASLKSNPALLANEAPLPYQVVSKTDNSVTIRYSDGRQSTQSTYYMTADGQCIYTLLSGYKDYYCK